MSIALATTRSALILVLCLIWMSPLRADLLDLSAHGDFKKIYFIPDPSARNVEVRVFVPVGEVDHTGPQGIAHYLEHLVVWSADKVHGEGLRNREMNAWTSPYWTTYWNRGPSEAFGNLIRNARAVFEPVALSAEFMRSERDVVEREFDLRYRDNPTAVLFRETYHHLYGKHGLGRSVMGTPESLRRISPGDAMAFHEARYRPQDAYMLIYGPVTKKEAIAEIGKHLAALPRPPSTERGFRTRLPAPPTDELSLTLPGLNRDEVLIAGQVTAPGGLSRRKLWFSMLLLGDVLNSAEPGGLAKPLYYDDFVVTDIRTRLFLLPTGEIGFEIFFRPEDGISTPETMKRVRETLRGLVQGGGLPAETIAAIRDQTRSEVRRLERAKASYHATIAQNTLLNLGEALDVKAYHYELGQSTVDDLNLVLQSIVESPFTAIAIAHPEESQ